MGLTIGRLASSAEINVETIRYYERRGLIRQPAKPRVGYRLYDHETLQRLLFIKRAKTLGLMVAVSIWDISWPANRHCDVARKIEPETR